jgi:multiple sugar transport system substrate-binding protein
VTTHTEIVPIKDLALKSTSWLEGQGGDLALLPTNIAMVNTSKLADETEVAQSLGERVGGYYGIGTAMGRQGTRWYNIPFCAWPHIWFYRMDLLRMSDLKKPTDLSEVALVAKALTKKQEGFYGLGIGLGQDEDFSMFLQTIIWSFGGSVVAADGKTTTLNSPAVRSAVDFIMDLYEAGSIPPGALGWDDATNNTLFLSRKIAMTANAMSIDYVAKRTDPTLYSVIEHGPYPKGPAGNFGFVQTFGWVVKADSPNRTAAEDFLRFLYQDVRLKNLFDAGEGAIAPLMVGVGSQWARTPYADAIQSVERSHPLGWPGPFGPAAAEVYNRRIVNNIFAHIINDHQTRAEAIRTAAAEVEGVYARYNAKN